MKGQNLVLSAEPKAAQADLRTIVGMMLTDPRVPKIKDALADGVYRIEVPCGDGLFETRIISVQDGAAVELVAKPV